jgi:uncharacterized membrane protein YeaQ/YmgE (transglycosylase-associated protein family)
MHAIGIRHSATARHASCVNAVYRLAIPAKTDPINSGDHIMNIIIWLVIGGVVGWLASIIMRRDGQQGIILNIVVGIVGAVLAGWFLSPLLGIGTINQSINIASFFVSLVGAVILLAIVNLITRRRIR